jgi:hypothetical protein
MAQTKRKRRSNKHRGNAAGIVEARGRTSRAETANSNDKGARFDKPPTWKGAAQRAAVAAAIFGVMTIVLFTKKPLPGILLTLAVFFLYVPLGYYTDDFLYQRRLKKKQAAKASK